MTIFSGAQKAAKISATSEELRRLQQAMRLYKVQVGELPPIGDSCPACYPDSATRASVWRTDALATLASTAGGGPYISNVEDFVFDAWGIAYWYDDNDEGFSPGPGPCQGGTFTLNSPLYSSGPDTLNGTADDIHFDIPCP